MGSPSYYRLKLFYSNLRGNHVIEKQGNIWFERTLGNWLAILTNGSVKLNGHAVMGRGIAQEAAERFPTLPALLGHKLTYEGNTVHFFFGLGLLTFPTKEKYNQNSTLKIIDTSCKTLVNILNERGIKGEILIPRPGCGNGKLHWGQVKPICQKHFTTDQFVIFSR